MGFKYLLVKLGFVQKMDSYDSDCASRRRLLDKRMLSRIQVLQMREPCLFTLEYSCPFGQCVFERLVIPVVPLLTLMM